MKTKIKEITCNKRIETAMANLHAPPPRIHVFCTELDLTLMASTSVLSALFFCASKVDHESMTGHARWTGVQSAGLPALRLRNQGGSVVVSVSEVALPPPWRGG